METIVLIDGNSLMHRSYHGIAKGFIPLWEGMPIGMVFGFASTLLYIIEQLRPDILIVAFDTKEKTFRHEMDENYKAQREKAPDDFYAQIPYIYELLESFEIPILKLPGYESDDIVGTIAVKMESQGNVKILSSDLDFLQLVSDKIKLVKFNGSKESMEYGPKETFARYGITSEQIIDFKSIIGDSSDNYKGIPGIGPKNAVKLLQEFQTLENIYENLDKLPEKLRQKFESNKKEAFHCKKLAEIDKKVPIEFNKKKFRFCPDSTKSFFRKMKFSSLEYRYDKLINNFDQNKNIEHKEETKKSSEEEQMSLF